MDFKFSQSSDCSELLCKSAGEQEQEEAPTIIKKKVSAEISWDTGVVAVLSEPDGIFTIIDLDSIFFFNLTRDWIWQEFSYI